MAYTVTNDDEFAAFAKRAEEEAEAQKNRLSDGGFTREYDPIKWVGLGDKAKIIRFVGGAPADMKPGVLVKPTDAHEIFISEILDDNNKKMKLKLPLHADSREHEHIMWRIINRVTEVKWEKGADGKTIKRFLHEYKSWFDRVKHGGYAPTDKSYQYSKGWSGQRVCIMNVIDREDNWCAENKHTKLLSKRITCNDSGSEYIDDGVPSYGFCSTLSNIVGFYGSWERYDLQIRRTGQLNNPYDVKVATVLKKAGLTQELDKDKLQYVSLNETLTPEELEYERYNIEKFYAPTSYQKLLSRLGNTIKSIDGDLRTNFYNELQALAEKEKADYLANHPVDTQDGAAPTVETSVVDDPYSQPITESTASVSARPTVREAAPVTSGLSADKISLIKYWNELTDAEKDLIIDVEKNPDGTLKNIVYKDGLTLYNCPTDGPNGEKGCGLLSPESFHMCPNCGMKY